MTAPIVLVTGAAGGIGYEVVRILLKELEASVVATDIVEGTLDKLSQEYPDRLEVVIGDITNPKVSDAAVGAAIGRFGKLTGLCLIAGVFGPCYRMADSPPDKWAKSFDTNVLSHLHTLRYALPELRKTSGIVTAATSAAGDAPLFSGWGFYGVSKAAVSFMIRQLQLEEPGITAVGISPGLCDTKMIALLLDGSQEGWTPEDTAKYRKFVSSVETITPTIAGNAYAQTVTKGDKSLAGLIVDYNDPRLPIADHLKRSNVAVDYTKHSNHARAD